MNKGLGKIGVLGIAVVVDSRLALAHGTGGSLGTRHGSATVIMERE